MSIVQSSNVEEEQLSTIASQRYTLCNSTGRRLVVTSCSSTLHGLDKVTRDSLGIIDNKCFTLLALTLLPNLPKPTPFKRNISVFPLRNAIGSIIYKIFLTRVCARVKVINCNISQVHAEESGENLSVLMIHL